MKTRHSRRDSIEVRPQSQPPLAAVQVGFFIDAIPRDGHLERASFKPSSRWTGPSLLKDQVFARDTMLYT